MFSKLVDDLRERPIDQLLLPQSEGEYRAHVLRQIGSAQLDGSLLHLNTKRGMAAPLQFDSDGSIVP